MIEDGWVRFQIDVSYVYKKSNKKSKRLIKREIKYVYVREDDLHCKCPKIRVNKTYLMIGMNETPEGRDGFLLDRESIVVRHKDHYDKMMKYYKKEQRRQSCYRLI